MFLTNTLDSQSIKAIYPTHYIKGDYHVIKNEHFIERK